jgi:hypothetical protein
MTTSSGFTVSPRKDGVEMVVTGRWSPEAGLALQISKVDSLVLNYALGFDEPDLSFLDGQPLRKLVVLDRRLRALDPIYTLAATLESLQLTTDPALTVDLNRLPFLTDLAADWAQVRTTFSGGRRLQRLFLGRYSENDLVPLTTAQGLAALVLKDRPRVSSLRGFAQLPQMTELGVFLATNLADVTELRGAGRLKELQLEACRRISTMEDLADCGSLEMLNLSECGDFPDVEPLRELNELQILYLYGTTKILNGDLTPIMQLPKLRELRMQNRRNYAPSVAEIQQRLNQSSS